MKATNVVLTSSPAEYRLVYKHMCASPIFPIHVKVGKVPCIFTYYKVPSFVHHAPERS